MDELIEVRLDEQDKFRLQTYGHVRMHGFDWINSDLPGHGRSVLPMKYAALFCAHEDRRHFPKFYERTLGEDPVWDDAPGRWCFSDVGRRELYRLYSLRYVSGFWTISEGEHLHIFSSRESCLHFLRSCQNFKGYTLRSPGGSQLRIQITIDLVE
jgi:hypothetical protein